jgi:N-glycosylase/DNA lyase
VISQDNDYLTIHASTLNVTDEWLKRFFSLDETVPEPVDEYSAAALEYCAGLRICKQDAWECLIAFLCSQNNNIKRIQRLMNGLARAFGKKVVVGKHEAYLFPNPGEIKANKKLSAVKLGYREKYVIEASKRVTDEWLGSLRELPYGEAREQLLRLHGAGPKVASCILLFAYQHNSFPIDTWIEQVMKAEYGCTTRKEMEEKAAELFGEDAGRLQQYIFHYARNR